MDLIGLPDFLIVEGLSRESPVQLTPLFQCLFL